MGARRHGTRDHGEEIQAGDRRWDTKRGGWRRELKTGSWIDAGGGVSEVGGHGRQTLRSTALAPRERPVSPIANGQKSYSGQAYGAFVNVGASPVYIAYTGALPSTGGWLGAEQMGAQVPNVLSAETLVAATSGALTSMSGNQVNSSTSLAGVTVLPGSPAQITASFVRAQADATSRPGRKELQSCLLRPGNSLQSWKDTKQNYVDNDVARR